MGSTIANVSSFDPYEAARVQLTVSCRDTDALPKVEDAGSVIDVAGARAQVMHNGVLVEEGGYFGTWMAEIIRCLDGNHEPQEELVVARVLERLAQTAPAQPTAIELGAFWAYYSLWFLNDIPQGKVLAAEPDTAHLELGKLNFALNNRDGQFLQAVVGPDPGEKLEFISETDGTPYQVEQFDLGMLMESASFDHVDILFCDVQGGENHFFTQSEGLFRSGTVRFAIVSTHHHSISGDPLTHQKLLAFFGELGAHIIAEHTVGESFSGDGLIAVAFDQRDADLVVHTSFARQGTAIFPALEFDLSSERQEAAELRETLERLQAQLAAMEERLPVTQDKLRQSRLQLKAMRNSRSVRYAAQVNRLLRRS